MILDRYLAREIAVPFLLGLFGLIALFMINQFVHLADLLVGRGMSLHGLLKVLAVLVPPFLLITLPAAIFLAGIVAFARLSSDSEFVALKASGVSFLRLMRPVLAIALLVAAAALWVGVAFEPWGKGKLKHLATRTLKENTGLAITPGTFNDLFGDVVVYAETATSSGRLTGIFISDERDPRRPLLVTALEGRLVQGPGQDFLGLHLTGGEIFRPGIKVQRVRFAEYDVKLRITSGDEPLLFDSPQALKAELERRRAAGEPPGRVLQLWLDRTKNVTFGAACLIFGLLGPALGLHHVRSGRMGGLTLGVVLILIYYVLISVAQALVMGERVPVVVGAWLPNALFLLGTLYVIARAQGDRPVTPWGRR